MFCSKCGNGIKEGERFCSNCGKSVNHIEKDKNSNNFNKKIIFVVLGIIVIVAIIGTIMFISNRKNSNVKNANANQMTNNIQQSDIIKENTKYISTGYNVNEDIEMGFSYLYLVFNNTTFKLHFDANFGGDVYDMFIKGTYSQNENHIIFDFSNAKIGFNENEEEVTAEYKSIVNTWANILNNGVNISDEGKTLIAIDNTGKTITFKSNEQNNIEANKNQINQNTKYVATGIEDFYKQAGITELYLVFNNDEFKFVCNMNIGGDEYETYIRGTYNQTENHIIFDFSNAKAGYNKGKLDETGNIIDSWAELFKDGATISNENKTLTIAEVDGITLAFEDSGIQVTNEEFNNPIENDETVLIEKEKKVLTAEEKEKVNIIIKAYGIAHSSYNGDTLTYRSHTLFGVSSTGQNVYSIFYTSSTPNITYYQLVSVDNNFTRIDKKSEMVQWSSFGGEPNVLLQAMFKQLWGLGNY